MLGANYDDQNPASDQPYVTGKEVINRLTDILQYSTFKEELFCGHQHAVTYANWPNLSEHLTCPRD